MYRIVGETPAREACEDCIEQVHELTHPIRAVTPTGEKKLHSALELYQETGARGSRLFDCKQQVLLWRARGGG